MTNDHLESTLLRLCDNVEKSTALKTKLANSKIYTCKEAAEVLGVSYSTVRKAIKNGGIKTVEIATGQEYVSQKEIERITRTI